MDVLSRLCARCIANADREGVEGPRAAARFREVLRQLRDGREPDLSPLATSPPFPTGAVWLAVHDGYSACAIRSGSIRVWAWFGKSEAAGEWGHRNQGLSLATREDGRPTLVDRQPGFHEDLVNISSVAGSTEISPPLMGAVDPELVKRINLPGAVSEILSRATFLNLAESVRALRELSGDYPGGFCEGLAKSLQLLAEGEICQAEAQLELVAGVLGDSPREAGGITGRDGERGASEEMLVVPDLSADEIEYYLRGDRYSEWLLFLHPDQRRVVDRDFNGPARLTGVSGSGKTIILLHRARELALRYAGEKVLVVTLRRSLAHHLGRLLDRLCTGEERSRIQALAVYDLCHGLLDRAGVDVGQYGLVGNGAKYRPPENVEIPSHGGGQLSSWQEFCEQPEIGKRNRMVFLYMARLFLDRKRGKVGFERWGQANKFLMEWEHLSREAGHSRLFEDGHYVRRWGAGAARVAEESFRDGFRYLRDELHWIRSAFVPTRRREYIVATRNGRSISLRVEHREIILRLLSDWEEWMRTGEVLDYSGVSLLAAERLQSILPPVEGRYRCVFVDEAQDLSTVELGILRALVKEEENGLVLAGDAAQQVYPKHSSLVDAGIRISGRAMVIRKNYRNTREILDASMELPRRWQPPVAEDAKGFQFLDPFLSSRHGPVPEVRVLASGEEQCSWVVERALKALEQYGGAPICIVSANPETRSSIQAALNLRSVVVRLLNGDDVVDHGVVIGEFEDVKGHEFPVVIVCDLTRDVFPSPSLPPDEWWRDGCHLYVAMTRATVEVVLTAVGEPSIFIEALKGKIRPADR